MLFETETLLIGLNVSFFTFLTLNSRNSRAVFQKEHFYKLYHYRNNKDYLKKL